MEYRKKVLDPDLFDSYWRISSIPVEEGSIRAIPHDASRPLASILAAADSHSGIEGNKFTDIPNHLLPTQAYAKSLPLALPGLRIL